MTNDGFDQLRRALEASNEATAQAGAAYAALRKAGRVRDHRILAYRCNSKRRCLLLDVVRTPAGVMCHQPAYKLSPSINEASSSAEGRERNTSDGDRHWRERTYFREQASNVTVQCDHVRAVIPDADLDADIQAGHAVVVLDTAGHRSLG